MAIEQFLHCIAEGIADCQGNTATLKDLMVFATASESVPHLGFERQPLLKFRHPEDLSETEKVSEGLPFVNTCALTLHIPVVETYRVFVSNMMSCIKMLTTFSAA